MNYSQDVCIIIPIYKSYMSDLESISFNRIVKVFFSRRIYIICPPSVHKFANQFLKNFENVAITTFNEECFKGFRNYNRLLMSNDFYDRFSEFNYVLMCQLDVFVIKDELDYWIAKKADNIGAPLFEGFTNPSSIIKKGSNGGFCLRNTKSCLLVLSSIKIRYSKIKSVWKIESVWYRKLYRLFCDGLIFNYKFNLLRPIINEDIFWSVIVPEKFTWFKVADPEEAKYFAFDANPRLLFKMCNFKFPMAIHAWWKYDKHFILGIVNSFNPID